MKKKEAINILIGFAVCLSPKLSCDEHCPFHRKNKDCKYVEKDREFEIEKAVKLLLEVQDA